MGGSESDSRAPFPDKTKAGVSAPRPLTIVRPTAPACQLTQRRGQGSGDERSVCCVQPSITRLRPAVGIHWLWSYRLCRWDEQSVSLVVGLKDLCPK
jgi:hypothetical protein